MFTEQERDLIREALYYHEFDQNEDYKKIIEPIITSIRKKLITKEATIPTQQGEAL